MSSQSRLITIGVVHLPFREPPGTPIQPPFAEAVEGTVEVFPEYADGLHDLDGFERIWLLYWFDRAPPRRVCESCRFGMTSGAVCSLPGRPAARTPLGYPACDWWISRTTS